MEHLELFLDCTTLRSLMLQYTFPPTQQHIYCVIFDYPIYFMPVFFFFNQEIFDNIVERRARLDELSIVVE